MCAAPEPLGGWSQERPPPRDASAIRAIGGVTRSNVGGFHSGEAQICRDMPRDICLRYPLMSRDMPETCPRHAARYALPKRHTLRLGEPSGGRSVAILGALLGRAPGGPTLVHADPRAAARGAAAAPHAGRAGRALHLRLAQRVAAARPPPGPRPRRELVQRRLLCGQRLRRVGVGRRDLLGPAAAHHPARGWGGPV